MGLWWIIIVPLVLISSLISWVVFSQSKYDAGKWLELSDPGNLKNLHLYIRMTGEFGRFGREIEYLTIKGKFLDDEVSRYDLETSYKPIRPDIAVKLEELYQQRLAKKKNALAQRRVKSMERALKV